MVDVVVPEEAADESNPASVTHWFFEDGATVNDGDLICELMVEKVAIEVRAPSSGRLKILVPVDSLVVRHDRLAEIG
jgi:pyruvate/2-oxoglutarate dehydrogenase complex dihydrolipoamide acyltransferase (E2) component